MSYASGGQANLNYIMESVWGTTPTPSPAMKRLRFTTEGVKGSTEQLQSQEMRGDRQIAGWSRGAIDAAGPINFEFSPDSYDEILEAALFGAWNDTTKKVTGTTISFSADNHQILDSGDGFVSAGFAVGDLITVSGSTSNDGYYIVTVVAAGVLTIDETWNDVPLNEVAGDTVTVLCSELKAGTTRKFFTLEKAFSDITKYILFKGCMIDGLSLNLDPNAMVTGSFDVVAKSQSTSESALDASVDDVSTAAVFEGSETDMILKEGGSATGLVTNLSFQLRNNLGAVYAVGGGNEKAHIPDGRCVITGQLQVLFESLTLLNKWLNRTESSLDIVIPSATKSNGCYRIYIPAIEYSGETPVIDNENLLQNPMPFGAKYSSTWGTAMVIQR